MVVIAIIGVAAACLTPVLGKAREGARRAMCANNLRQIGIAMHMYIDDHNNKFPAFSGPHTTVWCSDLSPYLDDNNVWNCPSYRYSIPLDAEHSSYGYNALSIGSATDINLIKSWSTRIMFTDSSDFDSPYAYPWIDTRRSRNYPGTRHSGGANVLFLDGHVSWYLQSFLLNEGLELWYFDIW
ncbi:MAG: DUF1559 domain-containing protein [Candidatus Omnitrophica bacterium]|nr:DUF1559 domain-containing protein [Candidatus Omnitrophota bacterium]